MSARVGEQLGDYRIVRPIGAGGMGEVYLAEHVHLRRPYALKILSPRLARDAGFVARFHDEARVMADLQHPHIVQVHHMGRAGDRLYLVMDYIKGPKDEPVSLHAYLHSKPDQRLPEKLVSIWSVQIAAALRHAHRRGVVHRDLKPGNILIDEKGNVRLSDFGLAKAVGEKAMLEQIHESSGSLSPAATIASPGAARPSSVDQSLGDQATLRAGGAPPGSGSGGSILGTYDYMAPEQRGELANESIGPATDIYAFGVLLYRILTGRRPVGMVEPPSRIVPGISKRWDSITARCMRMMSGERYQSADALLEDLRIVARKRRIMPIALSAAAVAAVIAIGSGVVWMLKPKGSPPGATGSSSASASPAKNGTGGQAASGTQKKGPPIVQAPPPSVAPSSTSVRITRMDLDGQRISEQVTIKGRLISVPDDHPTVQAAIDAAKSGDTVLIKPGSYREEIELKEGVYLLGTNREQCRLMPVEGANAVVEGSRLNAGSIRNLMFDGYGVKKGDFNPDGVYLYECNVDVLDCIVQDFVGAGIEANKTGGTFRNNICRRNNDGFDVNSDTEALIESNVCIENNSDGIDGGAGTGLLVIRLNQCSENRYVGIRVVNQPCVIEGNVCRQNSGGISTWGNEATVRDNVCSLNQHGGIDLSSGMSGIVENNTCEKNTTGFSVSGEGNRAVLRRNRISDNSQYGISISRGAQPQIDASNILSNNAFGSIDRD